MRLNFANMPKVFICADSKSHINVSRTFKGERLGSIKSKKC